MMTSAPRPVKEPPTGRDTRLAKRLDLLGALLLAGAEANPTMGFQVDTVGSWNVFEAARLYCQNRGDDPVRVLFPSTIASFGRFIEPGSIVANEGEYYNDKGRIDFYAVTAPIRHWILSTFPRHSTPLLACTITTRRRNHSTVASTTFPESGSRGRRRPHWISRMQSSPRSPRRGLISK
jgi:hypothetical protein